MIYSIDKRFQTTVTRSNRVMECAEAFGLGLEEREFVIYENLELAINQGDVVYITGQSGSGKSQLLKGLAQQMAKHSKVANIDEVALEDRPLIDQVGRNTEEAIRILSSAGLNDAYLFIRRPQELSDGQLYRFRVAKLMESDADIWVADEFGAVLDRVTARVVAFNVQKQARRLGKTLMVATTHKDMKGELGPNLYIDKRFRERVDILLDATAEPVLGPELLQRLHGAQS